MDDLLKMEGELVANLESYAAVLTNKAKTIRRGVLQMKEVHQRMKKEKLTEFRALNSYSLIRHMQADWLMWNQYLEHSSYAEHLAFVESKKEFLPKEHDFSMHTGCPLIVGSKWVVSKWIDDKRQEFRRPCIDIKANSKHSLSVEKLF